MGDLARRQQGGRQGGQLVVAAAGAGRGLRPSFGTGLGRSGRGWVAGLLALLVVGLALAVVVGGPAGSALAVTGQLVPPPLYGGDAAGDAQASADLFDLYSRVPASLAYDLDGTAAAAGGTAAGTETYATVGGILTGSGALGTDAAAAGELAAETGLAISETAMAAPALLGFGEYKALRWEWNHFKGSVSAGTDPPGWGFANTATTAAVPSLCSPLAPPGIASLCAPAGQSSETFAFTMPSDEPAETDCATDNNYCVLAVTITHTCLDLGDLSFSTYSEVQGAFLSAPGVAGSIPSNYCNLASNAGSRTIETGRSYVGHLEGYSNATQGYTRVGSVVDLEFQPGGDAGYGTRWLHYQVTCQAVTTGFGQTAGQSRTVNVDQQVFDVRTGFPDIDMAGAASHCQSPPEAMAALKVTMLPAGVDGESPPVLLDWVASPRVLDGNDPLADCLAPGSSCVVHATDASRPATAPDGDNPCLWGTHVVQAGDCVAAAPDRATQVRRAARTTASAAPSPGSSGGAEPTSGASPGADDATPQASPSASPGAAGAPAPGDAAGAECYPTGWGAFNPLEWVYKPVMCALRAAFIPSAAAGQSLTDLRADAGTRVPFSDVTAAAGWVSTATGGGNQAQHCLDFTASLPGGSFGTSDAGLHMTFLDSCDEGSPVVHALHLMRPLLLVAEYLGFLGPLGWWAWKTYAPGAAGSA